MLRRASRTVADCYQRASEAAERAARASNTADREFWLAREQRWLDLAKHQEVSERLDDFVQTRSARFRAADDVQPISPPSAEEGLRLLIALNSIADPKKLAEILNLAERLARDSPEFAKLSHIRRTTH